ncbi:Pyridine nucleotide-disulfide oxidoreductase domain-containing protein 2 [Rhynchospora pubera]|uniref:Pyridine nucleotide-disulfide oxidoreductase domain-containing protein 2 n=1 Tax=Rhynchospora pubera TaxID=906938 RepID=A0AAV8GM00_9POAL|nr:Pyridine nucleotide-disulfide oxidoreductase domain-containing protein 2 [Rhynchospora pubera]
MSRLTLALSSSRRRFSATTSSEKDRLARNKWDALVIGGGHNGLTAAAYLARSGLSVAVLERRHLVGGAAVTEEIVPGFKFSRCSYLQSLLRPSVIRDLELERHGLKLYRREPSSFTPCLDGKSLLLGPDKDLNQSEIAKFSKKDAIAYPRYEMQLEKFCKFMDFIIDSPPPEVVHDLPSLTDKMKDKVRKSVFWSHCLQHVYALGHKDMVDFMDLVLSPASKVLNNWFEGEVLKATLATDSVIGTMGTAHTPGSGYVLLHHVMGETNGERGIWSYVEGGMGSVSSAISNAALEAGVHIMTNAEVKQLLVDENTKEAKGVVLADGTEVHSSVVLSNATAHRTFVELVPHNTLSDDFLLSIRNLDYSSATTKINMAVDRLPNFKCCRNNSAEGGPEHVGTIHIGSESMEEIDVAYEDAVSGIPSRRPIIEMTIPSILDKTISPPGQHVVNLFVQYTPYKLSEGSWRDPVVRESFARRCFSLIDEYAPGFSASIIGYDMLTPLDLEKEFGLTGGNIFHGAMGLDSLFLMRPTKGWSGYRTPLKGLYLCGSGAHPGGGVMGAPGRNAASVVIADLNRS